MFTFFIYLIGIYILYKMGCFFWQKFVVPALREDVIKRAGEQRRGLHREDL